MISKPLTRRGVIYSMFVPLGFIAPYIMKAKLLLQLLCSRKCGWDDQLGEDEQNQWTRWREDLPKLVEVKFSRCFNPETFGGIKTRELHLFSDASRQDIRRWPTFGRSTSTAESMLRSGSNGLNLRVVSTISISKRLNQIA